MRSTPAGRCATASRPSTTRAFSPPPDADLLRGEAIEDRVGGRRVTIRFDRLNESARAFDAAGDQLAAMTGFWFAWYVFHPDTGVLRAVRR
ncbi:hypothetical protein [uncultured Thiohalocapsa sp.]|uniref:hypothetical protein n=1 Tax=uncultured Thiohalocapsa sp. TaxID=768990 RepID=UPI0025EFAE2E|nr:hypothetical protein [uncultured Thiohalocapsa sp.]